MNIAIIGASGFIGSKFSEFLLTEKNQVVALTRNPEKAAAKLPNKVKTAAWDGSDAHKLADIIDGLDAVVNLAGESLADGAWTVERKKILINSRVIPAKALADAMLICRNPPRVVAQGSAIGYYGYKGASADEESSFGDGFLASVCGRWEEPSTRISAVGARVALLRTGVVFGKNYGALPLLLKPFKLFVGGPVGSGGQHISWIHIDDAVRAIAFILRQTSLSGAVNLVSPDAVTMDEFAAAAGKALKRPSFFRVPGAAIKLAMGEKGIEMVLGGVKVKPSKLLEAGFEFKFPSIDAALADLK